MATSVTSMPGPDWTDMLACNSADRPYAHLRNCITALEQAPEWQGVLAWNEFKQRIEIMRMTPWGKAAGRLWEDNDDRKTAQWLQGYGIHAPTKMASEAVETAAKARCIQPVSDWLASLAWDNVPRLDDWLSYFLGTEDSEYTRTVGRRWLISAVARAFQPGCKADCVLILEGAQGSRKSTALSTLAGPDWFSDYVGKDLSSKETAILCSGVWIVEFSELEAIMSKESQVETVKSFLSRTEDRYRPHYGRHPITVPRQCVFAATTNDETYMRDNTGNRRFWPVKCGDIRINQLRDQRTLLWAEAAHAYCNGEEWHLDRGEEKVARIEQACRMELDVWHDQIAEWMSTRKDISVAEILDQCLRKDIGNLQRADQNRVGGVLARLGYERYRVGHAGVRRWRQK